MWEYLLFVVFLSFVTETLPGGITFMGFQPVYQAKRAFTKDVAEPKISCVAPENVGYIVRKLFIKKQCELTGIAPNLGSPWAP